LRRDIVDRARGGCFDIHIAVAVAERKHRDAAAQQSIARIAVERQPRRARGLVGHQGHRVHAILEITPIVRELSVQVEIGRALERVTRVERVGIGRAVGVERREALTQLVMGMAVAGPQLEAVAADRNPISQLSILQAGETLGDLRVQQVAETQRTQQVQISDELIGAGKGVA